MLRAGVMEGQIFQPTTEGTPQGGILSPLLANIYLHEFDRWWWETYGNLSVYEKQKRRKAKIGNCILTRYADDFLLLCNGPHAEVLRLREEVRQVLWEKLHLELAMEKTHVTHATNGFDFLGFHLQYKHPRAGKPWLRVTPSKASVDRFKRRIKQMTGRSTTYHAPLDKVLSMNRVMRGWNQYYAHVNATQIASKLTYWANDRFYRWLCKRHKRPKRWVMQTYRQREHLRAYDRWNMGVSDGRGRQVNLYQLTDLHRTTYYPRRYQHPYLTETGPVSELDTPFPAHWEGHASMEKAAWSEGRLAVLKRDNYRCTNCGSTTDLHIHHKNPRRKGGKDEMDNLQTLCADCHRKTTLWGRPRGTRNRRFWKAG
ncbi:MAG: hypothetical protein OHK0022_46710 [Roseiflexaceae bacterium]